MAPLPHGQTLAATVRPGRLGPGESVLECTGLVRRFGGRTAVDGVGFRIGPGETYGLLGPNGAGKTTTIRLVCGLLEADAGTVLVAGRPVTTGPSGAKEFIGYVPQEIALYPDLTVAENLRFFARLQGLSRLALEERLAEVLDLIDLVSRSGDRVESLSGGMRRRLNIGVGLMHTPTLLVLDEPTAGVDPQSRHAILERVTAFGEQGMAVLYTTHYMEEAERLCDRVGIIDHGRLIAEGTPHQLVTMVGERDRIELAVGGSPAGLLALCRSLEGVETADAVPGGVQVIAADGASLLPELLEAAGRAGVRIKNVDVTSPDLEAVFLHLTGTALRE
jgi:linearmycin/streptolysin S transport system ATP-binding protein